jgi:hypothetical protein
MQKQKMDKKKLMQLLQNKKKKKQVTKRKPSARMKAMGIA